MQLWPTKPIVLEALRATFERAASSDTDVLLCLEAEGQIVGFCAYALVNNLWQEGQIAYIYAMVVDEACRGKGFGTRLINEAIAQARRQGLKRVELDSGFTREKAHAFYERLGFEKRAYLFSYIL
ncbi:MAG: GNAT family N-acetyltransferase [Bacillota bacterium]